MTVVQTDIYLTSRVDGVKDFHCLDPKALFVQATRLGLETSHWWGKPNGYYGVRGRGPGRAFLLLSRKDAENINASETQTLNIKYGYTELSLTNLYLHSATALYTNSWDPGDGVPYLVELVDKRSIFAMGLLDNKSYNVICPAPDANADTSAEVSSVDKLYYADSLNAGTVWTWQQMLDDIAGEIPGSPGTPTLPFSPDDIPRNFRFVGVSAWDAYNTILEKIGCVAIFDPNVNVLSIDKLATTQDISELEKNDDLLASYAPVTGSAAIYPEKIRVYFHRIEEHFGSEKEIQQATGNWIDAGPYVRDYTTNSIGAVTGTILPIWDDMPAIYTFDNTHLNATACNARGDEVAANLTSQLENSNSALRVLQRGLKTTPSLGSKIAKFSWTDKGIAGFGMVTEFRGSDIDEPPRIGTPDPFSSPENCITPVSESLQPTNLSRRGTGTYPRATQIVRISSTAPTDGIYDGYVVRFDPEQTYQDGSDDWVYTDGPFVYILPLGLNSPTELEEDSFYVGRLIGSRLVDGSTFPLFAVENPNQGGAFQWGLVQTDPTNGHGAINHTVNIKKATWDGDESGAAFDAKTEYLAITTVSGGGPGKDTALWEGSLVKWRTEPDTQAIIFGNIWDDAIGTIKAWNTEDTIRDGWRECDGASGAPDTRGRYLRGEDTDDDAGLGSVGIGGTGGVLVHTHDCHGTTGVNVGSGVLAFTSPAFHEETAHLDPWFGTLFIERFE